ncbi:hypothetical protein VTJ83DRAFT_1778 [Remersonia thermophila]|uniref:Alpha-ketoglutarate-dependent dioxygenase AlkB-like domain-containing protein n=1 Tax=Remersonia thermophila TaxID=72144 RepID=A0ABR4DJ68_9PEZI
MLLIGDWEIERLRSSPVVLLLMIPLALLTILGSIDIKKHTQAAMTRSTASAEQIASPPARSAGSASPPGSPVLASAGGVAGGSPSCHASTPAANGQTALLKRMPDDQDLAISQQPAKRIRVTRLSARKELAKRTVEVEVSGGPVLVSLPTIDPVPHGVDPAAWARPLPGRQPLVWAKGRGALCEALPYFRSFKSSVHSKDVVAQGFLIDSATEARDFFGAQVIISSVALKNAYQNKSLVAVIAGEANPLYPCRPPCAYAVLGWFHITDIWREQQKNSPNGKHISTWRVRFERADLTGESWWIPKGVRTPDCPGDLTVRCPIKDCKECKTPSKEIFTCGWMCLNFECKNYFTLPRRRQLNLETLAYTGVFLRERTPFEGGIPPIRPPVPDASGCHGTELALRVGFVCPDCGCCNRRVYWNRWVCENPDCGYSHEAPMLPYPAEELLHENEVFDKEMQKKREKWGVNGNWFNEPGFLYDPYATIYHRGYLQFSQTLQLGGFHVRQYFLPNSDGQVLGSFSILSASTEVNGRPGGSDDLFRQLELTDIGLRRNPAAVFGHKLEGYTRHFQQNFGARYKFGVSVQSKGFDEAPDVILQALHRLIWAKKMCVAHSNAFISTLPERYIGPDAIVSEEGDFNELLALGYMEKDKINYHDDGESELGPVVAALSLGSPSTMSFRFKRKSGFWFPMYTDRGRLCYKEALEVVMKHGDMMVMVGPHIQKIYEDQHTVDPHGKRRFSLTARYIDPAKMTSQEDIDDAAVKGAIPEHAKAFTYDGF